MKYIQVEVETESRQISHPKPNYGGGGYSETSHDIGSVFLTSQCEDSNTFPIPDGLQAGDPVFLLVAQWHEGDSFNQNMGAGFEVIGVYADAKIAFQDMARLRDDGDGMLSFMGGREYCRPWNGYFESLDWLDVQTRVIERGD